MRGGDRLVNECSWMSGICFSFYHSTYCCGDFKRSPPLISLFCQSVPKCRLPKNPASPRGKPRNASPLAVRKLLVRTVYYRGYGRIAAAEPPTGRLLVDPYRGVVPSILVLAQCVNHVSPDILSATTTQKSTTRMSDALLVDDIGLEPMTFRTSSGCSSQLS